MQTTIDRNALTDAITRTSRIALYRYNAFICRNLLIESDGTEATVTASQNGVLALRVTVPAATKTAGQVALPADTLSALSADWHKDVSIVNGNGHNATLLSGDSTQDLKGGDPAEFPDIRRFVEKGSVSLDSGPLLPALERALDSAAEDETRPILCGVCLRAIEGDSTLIVAGSDGFRVTESRIPLREPSPRSFEATLPADAASALIYNLRRDGDSVVRLYVATVPSAPTPYDQYIVVRYGRIELYTPLVSGNFPVYTALLPKDKAQHTVTLPVKEFIATLKQIKAIYAVYNKGKRKNERVPQHVTLCLRPNVPEVSISTRNLAGPGQSFKLVSQIKTNHGDADLGQAILDLRFLLDAAESAKAENAPALVIDVPALGKKFAGGTTHLAPVLMKPSNTDSVWTLCMQIYVGK